MPNVGASHTYLKNMIQSARKLVIFLLLLSSMVAFGRERYDVRVLPQGKMYFFMPYKLKGKAGNKLQYDMTLLTYRDSVTINMTLTSPLGRVKSISLSSKEASFSTTEYELFFQERNGSRFNTRVHIDCPNQVYKQLFASQQPITFELTMEDGKRYAFTYKPKKWEEESTYVSEVLEMIDYSNSRN